MLAGVEALEHQRAVRPALGEDRDRVDVLRFQHGLVRREGAGEALCGDELFGPVGQQVGDVDVADAGVGLEQGGELARELAGADDADGEGHGARALHWERMRLIWSLVWSRLLTGFPLP